ncbi:MAG TPA: signal peptide peptidase SppA [Chloroflexi bacterium]|nr:signal peptide peptidase SppA [Chloroflexota bacterium]
MKDRTMVWVFLAFLLGFTLPVCSCVGSGFLALSLMGRVVGGTASPAGGVGDAVAVIRLDGAITSDPNEYLLYTLGITPERTADLLEQAAADVTVKAIVVHVNSPGGSVVASDRIYRMLLELEKPVVIWMGEMAASGGYYIACGGDYVFAHPHTLTGSIGVISQFLNVEDLMEKIGVDAVVITSGPSKDIGSPFREMTEEEQSLWESIIDETYDGFVQVVAQARDLPLAEVQDLADGRIYTGQQALALGLVDELGVLEDAVAKAAALGGIEGQPRVVELETPTSFFDLMYGFQARSAIPTLEEMLNWGAVPSLQFRFVGP